MPYRRQRVSSTDPIFVENVLLKQRRNDFRSRIGQQSFRPEKKRCFCIPRKSAKDEKPDGESIQSGTEAQKRKAQEPATGEAEAKRLFGGLNLDMIG